jgi:hypothetical protein
LLLVLWLIGFAACAQNLQAGLWHYRISTDLEKLPKEQHANFQTVQFERCLSLSDIQNGNALKLQTAAKSADRCVHSDFELDAGKLSYRYQCDGGSTLIGQAQGQFSERQFRIHLVSEPKPSFDGITHLHQTLTGQYKGHCKTN